MISSRSKGYARGHSQKVLQRTGVLSQMRARAESDVARRRVEAEKKAASMPPMTPTPTDDDDGDKPVLLGRNRVWARACSRHGYWYETTLRDGQIPPRHEQPDRCPSCIALRDHATQPSVVIEVPDPRTSPPSALTPTEYGEWIDAHFQDTPRPGSIAEWEVLAEMDEARERDIEAVERHKRGLRGRRRRGYSPPAFRTHGAGWDLDS